jgi:hypothetical protein
MITRQKIVPISFLLLLSSCVTQFIPKVNEDKELLVVEGLITDQPDTNIIKLSKSLSLGTRNVSNPVKGCTVTISDDLSNIFDLTETSPGTYITDPSIFQGAVGRFYTLHIKTNAANNNLNYESFPMELKPVPLIDSVYYEKVIINEVNGFKSQEGAQVYLNTHDATDQNKFYRWEYSETWEFILPYTVPNKTCWTSSNSDIINIKNTSLLGEDRIDRYPLKFISNLTDRLRVEYSILVKQYSLNEDEYLYWEKLQSITEHVGGLYDIIPSSVPSNVYCVDDPNEKVLGYFSVSANTSKRLFIKENFAGIFTQYTDKECINDTVFDNAPIPSLNTYVWIIIDHQVPPPPCQVTTRIKGCYDCTTRGTNIKPEFWKEGK